MAFIILITVTLVIVLVFKLFMQQPQFGKPPAGDRLNRIENSPNYKDGVFQNQSHTPSLTEGATYFSVMKRFFFGKKGNTKPPGILPSKKTDLMKIDPKEDLLVWFGHSSYFMQLSGKKFLVDPVFSGNASPFSFTTGSFPGSDIYTVDEIPEIDYLFLSHDHYDHLDYKTIKALRSKVKKVITALGVGAHLEHWGYGSEIITEMDWNEQMSLNDGFVVNSASARHFSGRVFKRNGSLWTSFILSTPSKRIYIGGDSGYDTHFATIGNQFGPFDLVILEDGQYNKDWKYIHMMPEEVVQAAIDLKAKRLLPVHWAKFALGLHDWDEPIKRVVKEAAIKHMPIIHPMIGEAVNLDGIKDSVRWWETVK